MGGDINTFWDCGWDDYHILLNIWKKKNDQTREEKGEYTNDELDDMYKALGEKMKNGT